MTRSATCLVGSESSGPASRNSNLSAVSSGQQQQHQASIEQPAGAAAEHDRLHIHAEPDWSDNPILGLATTDVLPPEDPYLSSGSMYGAGDWLHDGVSIQKQRCCQATAADNAYCSGDSVRKDRAAQQPHFGAAVDPVMAQLQPSVHVTNFSSKPLLPQSSSLRASPSAQSMAESDCRSPHTAERHLDACDSSVSSQQDSGTPLHTGTSAGSSYTQAGSLVSKACSSPVQHELTGNKGMMSNSQHGFQTGLVLAASSTGPPSTKARRHLRPMSKSPASAVHKVQHCQAFDLHSWVHC